MMMNNQAQRMSSALEFQNLVLQGQASLGQDAVIQIVQDLKTRVSIYLSTTQISMRYYP